MTMRVTEARDLTCEGNTCCVCPRPCILSMFHQIELNSEHIESKLEKLEKLVRVKLNWEELGE